MLIVVWTVVHEEGGDMSGWRWCVVGIGGLLVWLVYPGHLTSQLPKCTCANPARLVGFCNVADQVIQCGSPCCVRLSRVFDACSDGRCQWQKPITTASLCSPLEDPTVACGFEITVTWRLSADCPYCRVLNLPGNAGPGGLFWLFAWITFQGGRWCPSGEMLCDYRQCGHNCP